MNMVPLRECSQPRTMRTFTREGFDVRVRDEFPQDFDKITSCTGAIFAPQTYVFHEQASGIKLRLGYKMEGS